MAFTTIFDRETPMRLRTQSMLITICVALSMMACLCGGDDKPRESDRWEKKETSSTTTKKTEKKTKKETPKVDAKKKFKDSDTKNVAIKPKGPDTVFKGAKFNEFFPKDGSKGTKRIFKQEKDGFAQADYEKGGKSVVVISITDMLKKPTLLKKYETAPKKIKGFPAVERGKTSTAVLVGQRFQVNITSKTATPAERTEWLEKVSLKGLSKLIK